MLLSDTVIGITPIVTGTGVLIIEAAAMIAALWFTDRYLTILAIAAATLWLA